MDLYKLVWEQVLSSSHVTGGRVEKLSPGKIYVSELSVRVLRKYLLALLSLA